MAGGAALGGFAGLIMGDLGSLVPCTDTYAGPACVRAVAIGTGVVGATAGAILGGRDPAALEGRAIGGAVGFGIGTALGFGLTPFIERWAAQDALALGLIGGAVGTAPLGAALGFGVGAAAGGLLWGVAPGFGSPRAATFALAGLAAGVLTEWAVRALRATDTPTIAVAFHVPF